MKPVSSFLIGAFLLCISCSKTVEQENKLSEYYLINGLGRELVAEVYENIQGYFVAFGIRMQPGDSSLILKDLVPSTTKPSGIFTIIRVLESDSSTLISAITESNDYQWRTHDDVSGSSLWYYTIQ
jgi:hypothetical protein